MTQLHFKETEERLLAFSFVFLVSVVDGSSEEAPAAMSAARSLMDRNPGLRDTLMGKLTGRATVRVENAKETEIGTLDAN